MIIQTNRLCIRYITSEDWKQVKEIWIDFNHSEYAKYDKPHRTSDADVKQRIEKWAALNVTGTEHLFFAVCKDDTVIGYCAFNRREDSYEIGYCFRSEYQGKGYAKESISALLTHLQKMQITRFTAGTAIGNTPSVRLLTALGFRQIGSERVSFYKDTNGDPIVFDGGIYELSLQ